MEPSTSSTEGSTSRPKVLIQVGRSARPTLNSAFRVRSKCHPDLAPVGRIDDDQTMEPQPREQRC